VLVASNPNVLILPPTPKVVVALDVEMVVLLPNSKVLDFLNPKMLAFAAEMVFCFQTQCEIL